MNKVFEIIEKERQRQEKEICLIASENYMSEDVMEACGSVLINKYSEGRPNINVSNDEKEIYNYEESEYNRYYAGCKYIDEIEKIAIENACKLFKCKYANVQPNSGCQANQAVYMALLKPNDTILAMDINSGSHISHSLPIGFAGKYHNVVTYGLNENELINYEEIKEKLYKHNPKLLIVGASAYSRIIDFEKIRKIVNVYNSTLYCSLNVIGRNEEDIEKDYLAEKCYIMVDMAHIAGLVATGLHPSPIPYADVVTSTVQKTLRSGRGGIILTNNKTIAKKVDKAVFPCLQGGPLNNMIAGKAIGFEEALKPEFKEYQEQVLKNIKAMEDVFRERGVKMMADGSDNHLILLDLKDKGISGKQLEDALSEVGIVVNKNAVKDDPRPKSETSGIRLGTACITTRGIKERESAWIAHQICYMIDILTDEYDYEGIEIFRLNGGLKDLLDKELALWNIKDGVEHLCKDFPIYK